jgi:rSAM/selenodomain-associated transferase 1
VPTTASGQGGADTVNVQLIVLAKEPVAGRVKTRMTPPYTPEQAAALAAEALQDTFAAVLAARAARRVIVLAGRPGPWIPPAMDVLPQRGEGLDERLAAAFDDCFAGLDAPAVLIGMDTPQVTPRLLDTAGRALRTHDAVFGPAADGGFWLLGLRRPGPALLLGVPMSTARTGAVQLARLRGAGLRVAHLPMLADVDTAVDAMCVARQAPGTRFARRLAGLADSIAPAAVADAPRPATAAERADGSRPAPADRGRNTAAGLTQGRGHREHVA